MAVVELVLRLNVAGRVHRLLVVVRKVLRVVGSDVISDHWKERAMLAYAGQMFVASLILLVSFIAILSPLAVMAAVGIWIDVPFLALLTDSAGILVSVAIACAYLPLRRRLRHV
jgi:hypothetical protein